MEYFAAGALELGARGRAVTWSMGRLMARLDAGGSPKCQPLAAGAQPVVDAAGRPVRASAAAAHAVTMHAASVLVLSRAA